MRPALNSKRSALLAYYCLTSNMMSNSVAAFSSLSHYPVATALSDPSLLGDVAISDVGATFDVVDPGASSKQLEDGSAIIARVGLMGRDDAKAVSFILIVRCALLIREKGAYYFNTSYRSLCVLTFFHYFFNSLCLQAIDRASAALKGWKDGT